MEKVISAKELQDYLTEILWDKYEYPDEVITDILRYIQVNKYEP